MHAIRQYVRPAVCGVCAIVAGISRAQDVRGTHGSVRGDNQAVATNTVRGVGADKGDVRAPAKKAGVKNVSGGRQESQGVSGGRQESQGISGGSQEAQGASGGGMVLQTSEAGGVQQGNLEVVMELLSGSQPSSPPPPSGGGGGAMKAAALGGGSAQPDAENQTPVDSRTSVKMDPNQWRKTGS